VEWPYLDLGAVTLVDTDDRGVLVEYKAGYGRPDVPQHLLRLVPTGDTFVAEETTKPRRSTHREETVPAPFERTSLGNKWRLAWPQGATSIGGYARLVGWDDRFALVLDDRAVIVIDAESDRVVRLMLPLDELRWASDPIAAFGHVWIGLSDGVLAIPTSALETLAAGTDDLTLVRHYPLRKPKKRLRCVFLWFLQSGKAMLEIGNGKGSYDEPKLTIDMPNLGLAKYAPVTLVDELRAGHYTSLDVPGHERISIWTDTPFEIGTVKITVTRAKDPTGVAKKPASSLPSRRASEGELERLVAAIVANPSDDAQRAVLADLLLELGDPSAEAIVKLRADGKLSPAKLKEALGPLGIYLTKVECVGGFPVEATITRNAPDADDHPAELAAACADFRLGLIHTLHTHRRADRDRAPARRCLRRGIDRGAGQRGARPPRVARSRRLRERRFDGTAREATLRSRHHRAHGRRSRAPATARQSPGQGQVEVLQACPAAPRPRRDARSPCRAPTCAPHCLAEAPDHGPHGRRRHDRTRRLDDRR
jgi:uncharacterized protein (TIGR02996 family)